MDTEPQDRNSNTVSKEAAEVYARRIGRPEMTVADVNQLNTELTAAYRKATVDRQSAIAFRGTAAATRTKRLRKDRKFLSRTANYQKQLIEAGEHPDDVIDLVHKRDMPTKRKPPRKH